MRAVLCRALGAIDRLAVEDLPPPQLGAGQVRIAVHAAGVNFGEMLMVEGKYQEKPALPFTPGFEAAGVVREAASGVTRIKPGDRVMATLPWGGYADEAVANEPWVFPIPDAMDFVTAAGFPIAYGTAYGAFAWRAAVKPGETVLVLGAAGGVGLAAVEVGAALGATVIAAAGGREKCALALAHGATHAVDYRSEDLRERVKDLTQGCGVEVVFDPVGGDAFAAALRALAPGGRLLVVGFASGTVPQIPANLVLVKNVDIMGYTISGWRKAQPAAMAPAFARLCAWAVEGRLKPHISHRLKLEDAAAAFRLLRERKATGKIVLEIR